MSRVIRTSLWSEEPRIIDTPPPAAKQPQPGEEGPEGGSREMDEEARIRMLAEVASKERKAAQKLKAAEAEAKRILQEAEAERAKILRAAEEDAKGLRLEAEEKGRKQGLKEGRREAQDAVREEMQEAIREANQKAEHTLQTARDATEDYMRQAEHDVAKVVMHVVEKILPQHFIDVPQVILPVVQEAIRMVRDQKEVIVHVPPDSYDMALMARDEFRSMLTDGTATLEFTSDESLKPGDCVVETPNGGVDARLMTQIELVRQAVQGMLS